MIWFVKDMEDQEDDIDPAENFGEDSMYNRRL